MDSEKIYLKLRKIGCCNRCCLRYMREQSTYYENPEESLERILPVTVDKKLFIESNVCIVCLGFLSKNLVEKIFRHPSCQSMRNYDSDTYRMNMGSPPIINLRDKTILMYIKRNFPEHYELHNLAEEIPSMHEVFKLAFMTKFDYYFNKTYETKSNLQIRVNIDHVFNFEEISIVENFDDTTGSVENFGKNHCLKILSSVGDVVFMNMVPFPPQILKTEVHIETVDIECIPSFIVGRYCKYSRWLKQYYADDAQIEGNVSETSTTIRQLIFEGIREVFGFEEELLTFKTSGLDVPNDRVLGNGKPFYVMIKALRRKWDYEDFRKLEKVVNRSPHMEIFDIQLAQRKATREIQYAEEFKNRTYKMLCLIRDPSKYVEEIVRIINKLSPMPVRVWQQTPIELTSRRPNVIRERRIDYIKAEEVPGHNNIFQVTMMSQAGFHIAQFVTGEYGRTRPSLSQITGSDLDLIRLDLINIQTDFPPVINSVQHPAMAEIWQRRKMGAVARSETPTEEARSHPSTSDVNDNQRFMRRKLGGDVSPEVRPPDNFRIDKRFQTFNDEWQKTYKERYDNSYPVNVKRERLDCEYEGNCGGSSFYSEGCLEVKTEPETWDGRS